ncbi:MAG: HIT family protein [Gammaproteobacteria bacterium]|nr:HIT family protein [Gammaproteobacteria bacterium]
MDKLHQKLQQDCLLVGRFSLCQLLLMKDANYPWCILVPDRENISEIHQLRKSDQLQLIRESSILSAALEKAFKADKINVAALGNLVPQLHIHHVVRYRNDKAWPGPVWGAFGMKAYSEEEQQSVVNKLREGLGDGVEFLL